MQPKKTEVGHSSDGRAMAEAQAVIILLFIVLVLALAVKLTVGDSIVAAADRISKFRVWGAENSVEAPAGKSSVITISSPINGDTRYADEQIAIAGRFIPGIGRKVLLVYYRVNGGDWAKATITGNHWSGQTKQFSQGNYVIEAVAYDDIGNESKPAVSRMTVLFRYYAGSRYISDTLPVSVIAGERYPCQITFDNTGNIVWTNAGGYTLHSYGGAFGQDVISVPAGGIAPNARNSFTTTLYAPEAPGSYTVTYRMNGGGYGWFGDEFSKTLRVDPVTMNAKIVSMDIPAQMTEGDTYQAKITIKNTGTGTWYPDGDNHVDLGAAGGNTGDAYKFTGKSSMAMTGITEVRPDGEHTFQFQIKAPGPGDYSLKFRMVAKDSIWFGEQGEKRVTVKARSQPDAPKPTPDEPYEAYLASGNFRIIDPIRGEEKTNIICAWCYDGPLVRHNQRSIYVKKDGYADWDIGGPNGNYHIYSDSYSGDFRFNMDNGGYKGTVTFYDRG